MARYRLRFISGISRGDMFLLCYDKQNIFLSISKNVRFDKFSSNVSQPIVYIDCLHIFVPHIVSIRPIDIETWNSRNNNSQKTK